MKRYTEKEIIKKFGNKYIDVYRIYDYSLSIYLYEVRKAYTEIHENTTLGKDLISYFN